MKVIGICGGSGSGKTEALRILAADGMPTLNCDAVSRQVMQPGRSGKDTTKPPSSGSFTSSMRYGRARYSFNVFMILLAFYDLSDHFYIDSFDWFMLWHCDRPTTRFSESIVAAATARCTHHIAIGFQYSPKFIKPKFPAQRTDFTEQLFPF